MNKFDIKFGADINQPRDVVACMNQIGRLFFTSSGENEANCIILNPMNVYRLLMDFKEHNEQNFVRTVSFAPQHLHWEFTPESVTIVEIWDFKILNRIQFNRGCFMVIRKSVMEAWDCEPDLYKVAKDDWDNNVIMATDEAAACIDKRCLEIIRKIENKGRLTSVPPPVGSFEEDYALKMKRELG